jgi:sporulation protein YlmC with PRC-barrel domain
MPANYEDLAISSTNSDAESHTPVPRRVVPASKVTGDRVRNPAGEDLGKIRDIVIDAATGQVAYAVLAFGGVLGMGEKLFAVPWRSLTLNTRDHEFILNVDRGRLEGATGFDPEHWPETADLSWDARI